jgi:hypothetical protein
MRQTHAFVVEATIIYKLLRDVFRNFHNARILVLVEPVDGIRDLTSEKMWEPWERKHYC